MLDFLLNNKSSFQRIKESGLPVVIYGMGNGADKVIDIFNKLDIEIKGITASDDFVRGQLFREYKVTKLSEFSGDFILAPAFGTCIPEVIDHIKNLSQKYKMIFPVVPVCGDTILTEKLIENNADKINKAYNLFSTKSKNIFADCFNFMYSGDINDLIAAESDKNEIFTSFLNLTGKGAYIDCGAYRGDTIEEYLRITEGKYSNIIAVEPDFKTCKKLKEKFNGYNSLVIHNSVVYDYTGNITFNSVAGRQSSVSENGTITECIALDDLYSDLDVEYLKMDIEGSESKAIDGAQKIIQRSKPMLNIALYHKLTDIFEIPLKISQLNPDYKFEIRKHPYIPCWDMNLYCK